MGTLWTVVQVFAVAGRATALACLIFRAQPVVHAPSLPPRTDMTDEWRAAGVNPPTERRSITMPATSPTKAILAAVLAALVSLVTALQDKTSIETLGALGWILVLLSAAITGLTVYLVPNRPTAR